MKVKNERADSEENDKHQTLTCAFAIKSILVEIARLASPGVDEEDIGVVQTVALSSVCVTIATSPNCTSLVTSTRDTADIIGISEEVATLRSICFMFRSRMLVRSSSSQCCKD
jgi:hypothetical protein